MAYNKMLCWVNQKSKAEYIKITGNQNNIIFSDNYTEFKNNISTDSYLAISLSTARQNLNELKTLLKIFPNHKFRIILDETRLYGEVINAFTDEDKIYDNFSIENLIKDFNH